MSTFCNTMANILVYSLLILFSNQFAHGDTCTEVDSLHFTNINNCQIFVSNNETDKKIRNFIKNDQMSLLKIKLNFPEKTRKAILKEQLEWENNNLKDASFFYDLFHWQIIISQISKELLSLTPNFQTLSLNTLTIGVEVLNPNVYAKPDGCLGNVTHHQYLYIVKEYFIHFFGELENKDLMVCAPAMQNNDGSAKFHSICYSTQKKNGSRNCQYVDKGRWTHGLNIFIYALKTIAILFCPLLIPASIYTSKYVDSRYRLVLDEKIPIKVMVSTEKLPKDDKKWKFCLPISYFKKWKSFDPDKLEVGIVNNFEVTSLNLGARTNTLVSKAHVPASLGDLIYEKFYLCKIGNDMAFRWCCYSSICPKHMQFKRSSAYQCMSWMKCCRGFMKLVLVILIPQPWIIRLIVYHYYEKMDFKIRRKAADDQGLSLTFKGYLLGYVSPMHWFFLAIYALYVVDLILFGTLVNSVLRQLIKILKESFQDMHTSMSFEILRWGVSHYLVPFSRFGLLGILVAPFYWVIITPCVLILFCVHYIPLVSFFFRLLMSLIWFCLPNFAIHSKYFSFCKRYSQKTEFISKHLKINEISTRRNLIRTDRRSESCVHRHFQILVIFLCIVTVSAITILATECIGYLVDMVSFTLIGMIMHTTAVLPYFSFVFMIVIYLSTSINDVRLTYMNFNKVIVSEIISAAESDLKIGSHWADTAHFIKITDCKPPVGKLTFGKSGAIYFQATSLLLFINSEDHGCIPLDFFYRMCEMPDSGSPGPRSMKYCKALINFVYVLLFLIFVLMVVLSFGGMYNVSSTHQMFVTVAGGFVPYIFKNVVKLNPSPEQVDTSRLAFKKHFWEEIKNFEDHFKVRDFQAHLLSKENFQAELLSKKESTNTGETTHELDTEHTVIDIQAKTDDWNEQSLGRYVYFDGPFHLDILNRM